ncbi:restriction endonuclease subunit S [Anaerotignum sp.]|uniref:restriction endonuclease subunit S n=1 Tax=Anaerotignum sp. TaxID=2039241 RepID=UPI002714716C|nr:restriction endonuclease subunit S [Anaerotignum sp.]
MRSKWTTKDLGDIAEVTKLAGFEFTKYIEYTKEGEIIALRALNLRNGKLDLTDIKRIHRNVSDSLVRSKLYINDILLTYTGNGYGDCAIISENDKYHLAPNICKITPNAELVDAYYLYAYVRSYLFYQQMTSHIVGSGQPTIPMKTLRILSVPIPNIETQQKISSIISAFDEKIELNNKINENLEQQAQAIFKSWFVDFEPWGGVCPEDWEQGCLLDIADYLNGLAMQKYRPLDNEVGMPVLKIKELRRGSCDDSSDLCSSSIKSEYIINNGDVIFSWSGSLLVDFWCGGTCGLNQHLFKVTSNKYDKWFYYSWTEFHLERFIAVAADKATTMGHIKRDELKKAEVLIPSERDYAKIGGLLEPIYEMIISNKIENFRLSSLRDTLLPKLMSGEIDVSDIQI